MPGRQEGYVPRPGWGAEACSGFGQGEAPLEGAHKPPTRTEAGEGAVWPWTRQALSSAHRPLRPSRRDTHGGREACPQGQSLQAWPVPKDGRRCRSDNPARLRAQPEPGQP